MIVNSKKIVSPIDLILLNEVDVLYETDYLDSSMKAKKDFQNFFCERNLNDAIGDQNFNQKKRIEHD